MEPRPLDSFEIQIMAQQYDQSGMQVSHVSPASRLYTLNPALDYFRMRKKGFRADALEGFYDISHMIWTSSGPHVSRKPSFDKRYDSHLRLQQLRQAVEGLGHDWMLRAKRLFEYCAGSFIQWLDFGIFSLCKQSGYCE